MSDYSFITSNKNALVESAITTGSYILGDKLVYSQPIEMKKALLSFGSSYLSDMGVSYVQPMLTKMSPSLAEERYAKPLVSGALYIWKPGSRFIYGWSCGEMVLKRKP